MIFTIDNILSPEEIADIKQVLEQAEFVDGKLTAGWHAKLVKNNQQLKAGTSQRELKARILAALNKNALFQSAVRPKSIHSILFSRYDEGMSYDTHVDNALMRSKNGWCRSDISSKANLITHFSLPFTFTPTCGQALCPSPSLNREINFARVLIFYLVS